MNLLQGGPQDWQRFELRTRQDAQPAAADQTADDSGQLQLQPPQARVPDVPAFLAASQAAILATGECFGAWNPRMLGVFDCKSFAAVYEHRCCALKGCCRAQYPMATPLQYDMPIPLQCCFYLLASQVHAPAVFNAYELVLDAEAWHAWGRSLPQCGEEGWFDGTSHSGRRHAPW